MDMKLFNHDNVFLEWVIIPWPVTFNTRKLGITTFMVSVYKRLVFYEKQHYHF